MPERDLTSLDDLMIEIYRAIYAALESRLHLIGSVINAESRKEILAQQIYDKGDFYGNTGYLLQTTYTAMILRVGSNVRHEPFALPPDLLRSTLTPLEHHLNQAQVVFKTVTCGVQATRGQGM